MERAIELLISKAKKEMREMLYSIFHYNSYLLLPNENERLKKIIKAIIAVDRKFFVFPELLERCYEDNALPIGEGQTISQPSTVARMLVVSQLNRRDDVLEIGAGSGWNACLIAYLVKPGKVVAVDRIKNIIENAKRNLAELKKYCKEKFENLYFAVENPFEHGDVWQKKYDKIIVTAGISSQDVEKKIDEMADSLLKENGLLVCPYATGPLLLYKKKNKKLEKRYTKEGYAFVPLLEGVR